MSIYDSFVGIVDEATRARSPTWIVSSGPSGGKVRLKRTSTSQETCWRPYLSGLTLAVNDKVIVQGNDINTAIVAGKV